MDSGLGTYLDGVRILELADEVGEYCGKLLAGLGADVVKVEPPGGEATRTYGPFYGDDEGNPDGSLHFWHYNHGKRGITLDLDTAAGREAFAGLARTADVILDTRPAGYLRERGLGYEALKELNPGLIHARLTPFGEDGPWAGFQGSDLVHLALGGVMMNCGYDPRPDGSYDTPPIAPQMWQAYHIAGEMTAMSILAALSHKAKTGEGQQLDASVHQAVSASTESDLPDWVYLRQPHKRQTGRHSFFQISPPLLTQTKDGRYMLPYRTYVKNFPTSWDGEVQLLRKYGMQGELNDPRYNDPDVRDRAASRMYVSGLINQLVSKFTFDEQFWLEGLAVGLTWAPIRRPEENAADGHFRRRGTFVEVNHPELDRSFTYVGARWYCEQVDWRTDRRAPLLGEHTDEVLTQWGEARPEVRALPVSDRVGRPALTSKRGKPFALSDVRVIDLSWMVASAGAGRFLTALGADVIKVEHSSRPDGMRYGSGTCPRGGRETRAAASEPIPTPVQTSINQGGHFNDLNAGKAGVSLNLKDPRARELLEELLRDADVVVEGFSPGTMERMGLGYDRLREINPGIVYVQQTGLGEYGTYGNAKAFGPSVQGFSGITEMSGLPAPYPPAGIGYSYLDWFAAYNMANAVLAALYRRYRTGEGCHIDASQAEAGIYLTGTGVLDHSANGRNWARYGNTSPYKRAAPHGAYPAAGTDRWVALSAFTEEQWQGVAAVLGIDTTADERLATLETRLAHAGHVDGLIAERTRGWDRYALMEALQGAGVPAGVCQMAEDRYENDPQLAHAEWTVELPNSELGTWPIRELPVRMSATPSYIGGFRDRAAPNYGEDTDTVFADLLGLDQDGLARLREEGVI
ncbi:CaiB/BaiF CoA transferase family protein [Streptomyces sp. NPDC059766]|uniref:CaiB/BaiF CoA transferase family protein n=1 Tax=Streptomyces sp. NPDC059766 TaxID=3346940 RepID=UPI00365EDB89